MSLIERTIYSSNPFMTESNSYHGLTGELNSYRGNTPVTIYLKVYLSNAPRLLTYYIDKDKTTIGQLKKLIAHDFKCPDSSLKIKCEKKNYGDKIILNEALLKKVNSTFFVQNKHLNDSALRNETRFEHFTDLDKDPSVDYMAQADQPDFMDLLDRNYEE